MVSRLGTGGLQLFQAAPQASPWIQNLVQELDGSWRPRYGLELIKAYPKRISMLHGTYQATDSKHYIYAMTEESKLYKGAITEIATDTGLDMSATIPLANWNSEFKNAAVTVGTSDNPTATEKRLLFSFPGFGVTSQKVYDQTGVQAQFSDTTGITGAPFAHGDSVAVVQKNTLVWSTYADAYSFPVINYTYHNPEIGEGIVGVYSQENISYVLGTLGIYSIQGAPIETAKFTLLTAPPIAGPSATSVARCRDRIIYLAPGPSLYMIGNGLVRIDEPVHDLLSEYGDATYFSLFYDPLIDCCCVTPLVDQAVTPGVENITLLYSLSQQRWIGTYRHADSTKGLMKAINVGPNTDSLTVPRNRPPFGLVAVAASELLTKYDPTNYGDDNASGDSQAFPCSIETSNFGLDETPSVTKQLIDVYVDGVGEWEVILKYRDGSGEAWKEHRIGVAQGPGWVYADRNAPVYKERRIRLQANSSSALRLRFVGIRERPLAE